MPTVPTAPSGEPATPAAPPWGLPATTYLGIGLVGIVLLALGIWTPALASVPDAEIVRIVVAIAGGLLAVVGLGRWNVLRGLSGGGRRATEGDMKAAMPSIEFFRPPPPPGSGPRERTLAFQRMRVRSSALLPVLILLLAALIVSGVPVVPGTAGAAAPVAAAHPAASGPPVPKCDPPLYPNYGVVDGLDPPLPNYIDQTPCKVTHDEVHATFSSPVSGSGEEVDFPIVLPGNATVTPGSVFQDAYLGMVVQGDAASVDGQSYAELVFAPGWNGTGVEWNLTVAIWSLLTNTSCASGLNFSWEDEYGCVVDDASGGSGGTIATGVPGDQAANVTFTGSSSSSVGTLQIAFNDSTDPAKSANYSATAAHTGSYQFRPYYATACPDLCDLGWSEPFGLGLGIDLCDLPGCFSYNATTQVEALPFQVLSPESWNGLSFASDFEYVALESSTGACGGVQGIATCDPLAEIGEYPSFTFNGTALEFGGNYSWTTETFGGAIHEFNAYATSTDFTPLWLDELTNSSAAGYVAPGSALNVSLRIQDLGSIRWANLSYRQPGGGEANASMTLLSGAPSDGIYQGSIPSIAVNGTIDFRVVVTNRAGVVAILPPNGTAASSVVRSAIPTVTAVLDESPAGCGGIALNGGPLQPNGTAESLTAGAYALRASGCYPYDFAGWLTTGGISITGPSAPTTSVELHANGSVTAEFRYVVPHDAVTVAFAPTDCGAVTVNGTGVSASGGPADIGLLNGHTFSIVVTAACANESFSGWSVSSPANLTVLGGELTVHGNGTLTATFVADADATSLGFLTDPGSCGGVELGSAGYVNGSSIEVRVDQPYPVGPVPCAGWGFAPGNLTTSGAASYAAGAVSVGAAGGTVAIAYYRLTLVSIETSPAGCGGVEWNGVLETGGTVLNVTNHTVNSVLAEPCSGDYLEALSTLGNLTLEGTVLVVNGPGTVIATFEPGPEEFWVGFITNPISCGAVVVDGTSYANSQYVDLLPGSVHRISATACVGYGFVSWANGGGVALADGPSAESNLIFVNGSGSLEAIFHPLVAVDVETDPATCGEVEIGGTAYGNGVGVELPEGTTYAIAPVPCLHEVFTDWQTSGGATIAGGNLTLVAPAIVEAVFVPAVYAIHIEITPAACGPLVLAGVDESNNTTVLLTAGPYSLAAVPCTGFEVLGYSTDAGLSVSGTTLLVNGAGNLTQHLGPVPPELALAVPSSALSGSSVEFSVAVAVPVPPYNYTYRWSFGDGATATTPSNFTGHAYAQTGTYEVSVTVTDPYGRTATAFANVSIEAASSAPSYALGTTGLIVIGVGIAVVVAGAAVAFLRGRRPPRSEGGEETAPPEGTT
ncbi:MAG TPA: PKD domain-containing protein [Thermoplasmata archaeon]|nr:PKD domain-containing protein [Thermoplasmata archaeon]